MERSHEAEMARNREAVMQRPRMWATVGDDEVPMQEEAAEGGGEVSRDPRGEAEAEREGDRRITEERGKIASSRGRSKKRSRSRSRSNRGRSTSSSDASSIDSRSSTDSSSSESSSDHHRNKKSSKKRRDRSRSGSRDKKEKKRRKEKKDRKKHDRKEKKSKKDKRHKSERDRSSNKSASVAVNQNEFGKYGIIREEHFFSKQREFEAYMEEVKKMPGIMGQSKRDIREAFKGYVEDYNTATLPHPKYYHYAQWEMDEFRRKQSEPSLGGLSSVKSIYSDDIGGSSGGSSAGMTDEEIRRLEMKRAKEAAERREFLELKAKMAADKEKQESMRRQDVMKAELQRAYRAGDMATVRRLEKLLAPEEETGGGVKHPWA